MILFDLEKTGRNIYAKIPNTKDYVEVKKAVLQLNNSLKPYLSKMERNNVVGNGPRAEPLGVMIGGNTSVGKSLSTVPVMLAAMV